MRVNQSYSMLALVALFYWACIAACDDDDDHPAEENAGKDGGAGNSGRGGQSGGDPMSGRGGRGGAGAGAGADGGAGNEAMACFSAVADASGSVNASAVCAACLCDMRPAATTACTGDCWKLAFCAQASGCSTSDSAAIQKACVTPLGGMDKYMAAAILVRNVPFASCADECFGPTDGCDGG